MRHNKYFFAIAFMLLGALPLSAQKELGAMPAKGVVGGDTVKTTYLSPAGAMLRHELEKLDRNVKKRDTDLIERFALQRIKCSYYVGAIIELSDGYSLDDLKKYKIKTNSSVGNKHTVLIPTKQLAAFIDSGMASTIDISFPAKLR